MVKIQFSLIKKIKIGCPEHSLTPTPLRPITSHFCLTAPPTTPLKVDIICVSPLTLLFIYIFIFIFPYIFVTCVSPSLRSSHSQIFFIIGALKIFTLKPLCWILFLDACQSATLLKETPTHMFSCEYCEIFKSTFSYITPLVDASFSDNF